MTRHGTLTFERQLKKPPATVFKAFADTDARSIWAPPTPDLNMTYSESDFRTGGRDLCVCGPGPAEGVTVETLYHAITEGRQIVMTEIIGTPDGAETVALVTTELSARSTGTELKVTIQGVSLGEMDGLAEMEGGWTAALANLERYLDG
ncbi:MAG: SRPBCC domain-containing protein [Pseudomonadota bacterium]